MKRISETEIAAPVVAWLQEQHWDVYQEVRAGGPGDPIADIVARQKSTWGHATLTWVVEVKASLSLALLAQAAHWTKCAHYVSIATPETTRNYRERDLLGWILGYHGIGEFTGSIQSRRPVFHRVWTKDWERHLNDKQRTQCAAGSSGGGYWTPFQETCRNVRGYVAAHPGCSMHDMVESIRHHYRRPSTAVTSLRTWIEAGKVAGVRVEYEGHEVRLYPQEGA